MLPPMAVPCQCKLPVMLYWAWCPPKAVGIGAAQVSDLRRLLEMYRIWQQKHFPLHGFDEALDQIADIGKTNQLKVVSHCKLAERSGR